MKRRRIVTYQYIFNVIENSRRDDREWGIDGNFGLVSGIAEMLLQSHTDTVYLLPALPAAWKNGKVTGLRARDGKTYDIEWRDGRIYKMNAYE